MQRARALLFLGAFAALTACDGTGRAAARISPCGSGSGLSVPAASEVADADSAADDAARAGAQGAEVSGDTMADADAAPSPAGAPAEPRAGTGAMPPSAAPTMMTSMTTMMMTAPPAAKGASAKPDPSPEPAKQAAPPPSIGVGDLQHPAGGPPPHEAAKLAGDPFVLVKNWDFGSADTIRDQADLKAEFQFHDQFGTIANGTNYGAVTVAPSQDLAIGANDLDLPHDEQPLEDPLLPTREWTASSLLTHVRPLKPKQKKVSVSKHNAGSGSFTSQWSLPKGGALLGRDLVWETRVRMPKPLPGYWFALWTAGTQWNGGAEMDVLESFGAPHISADAFHSDAVGGTNQIDFSDWPTALTRVGVPDQMRALSDWHIWTWVYLRDDSFEVYYDGYRVQHGQIHWTNGGTAHGQPIDMRFLFDFSWGHTQIEDVDIELPAEMFPLTYEIDYSRVYMR